MDDGIILKAKPRYWIIATALGLLFAAVGADLMSAALANEFPRILSQLADHTPSIRTLSNHATTGAEVTGDLSGRISPALARATSVLYAMLAWALVTNVAFAVVHIPRAISATAVDAEYAKLKATYGGILFVTFISAIGAGGAMYPFLHARFLERSGVMNDNPLWWIKALVIMCAGSLAAMSGLGAVLHIAVKMRLDRHRTLGEPVDTDGTN